MKNKLINQECEFLKIEKEVRRKLGILFQYPMAENFKLHDAFAIADDFEEFSDFCEISFNEFEEFLDENNLLFSDIFYSTNTSTHYYKLPSYSLQDFIIKDITLKTIDDYVSENFRDKVSYYHLLEMIEKRVDFDTGEFTSGGIKGYYGIDDLNDILETWESELEDYENELYMFNTRIDDLIKVAKYIHDFKANLVENFKAFRGE